jgi:hypothetical protein
MSTYAQGTVVSVEKSKAEVDSLLAKHGAGQRGIMTDEQMGVALVMFVLAGRKYKLEVPLPQVAMVEKRCAQARGWWTWGVERRAGYVRSQYEQSCRERWRGVVLLIKAKLEIVRLGASTFEREFLADLVLPNGETAERAVGAYMERLLKDGYTGPLQLGDGS